MPTTTRAWRRLAAAALLGFAPFVLLKGGMVATAAGDADVLVFEATATTGDPLGALPLTTTYTFDAPAQPCFSEPFPTAPPSPLPGSIPGYLDVPPDEPGNCTAVSGGGTLTDLTGCASGLISMEWDLTEPRGDVAHVSAAGVVVSGLIVAATLPGGYTDDSSTISEAAVLGLMLPVSSPLACISGGRSLAFSAVIAAVY